jgi:hypothetical protein
VEEAAGGRSGGGSGGTAGTAGETSSGGNGLGGRNSGGASSGGEASGGSGDCVDGGCAECVADESDCIGTVPRICSPEGNWISQPACTRGVCVPEQGGCQDQCEDDETECVDSSNERRCVDGRWEPQECEVHCSERAAQCVTDPLWIPGIVPCGPDGDVSCDFSSLGERCQITYNGVEVRECSTSNNNGPGGTDQYLECDWHDDCPTGEVCRVSQCQSLAACTYCRPQTTPGTSNGSDSGPLCDPNDADPCPGGGTCALNNWSYLRLLTDYLDDIHTCIAE